MAADYPTPGANPTGGPQVGVTRLVGALARRGVEVIVAAPAPGSLKLERIQLEERVIRVAVPVDNQWSLLKGLRPWRRGVTSLAGGAEADLVHGQGLIPGGIGVADVQGIPRIVTARGNVEADTAAEYRGLGRTLRMRLRDRLARIAAERADVVVGVNPDWTVNVPAWPRRFVYIPNIIDERFFDMRRSVEPDLVLFAGGARAIKGFQLLAASWPAVRNAVPDARLLIAGWPADKAPPDVPRGHAGSMAVEGWLTGEELASRMARASVLVIPSQFEVSPIVLAEAWALGLPVVATAVGGLHTLAEGAASLVHQREPEALAAAIVDVLAGGAAVQQLVEEGRRRAEAHRAKAVAQVHLDLYTELVRGDPK